MIVLVPAPLTAEAFAAFGQVICFNPSRARRVNEATADRADTDAVLQLDDGAMPVLAIYRATGQSLPLQASLFERHPLSTQAFISISCACFLVVVAPARADGLPDAGKARAFLGTAGTGVSYRLDQWHMPILSIGGDGDLLMLMAERGTPEDCIEHRLPGPLSIVLPSHRIEGIDHGA